MRGSKGGLAMTTTSPTTLCKSRNWHTSKSCRWTARLISQHFHLCQTPSQKSASFRQIHTECCPVVL